ncbi:hypothetical protein [Actinoplanes sp. OR16]|uniref:hypothetical protein n=1 Tax=Actinoplanes sp. OR16 TaxID=946334 RepID=UPI000FD80BF0|nr:hypothetical protein [Actinoplanes sp. OR16]
MTAVGSVTTAGGSATRRARGGRRNRLRPLRRRTDGLLETLGDHAGADRVRRFGLADDGSPAEDWISR